MDLQLNPGKFEERQAIFVNVQPQGIGTPIGHVAETFHQSKNREHRRVDTHGDRGVALLDLIERAPTDKCPLRHGHRRYSALFARNSNVLPQFDEGLTGCSWQCAGCLRFHKLSYLMIYKIQFAHYIRHYCS